MAAEPTSQLSTDGSPADPFSFRRDFEDALDDSMPYRLARSNDGVDLSARNSSAPLHTWSSLSRLSLSDVSELSLVALPISRSEVTNSQHYTFGLNVVELSTSLPPFEDQVFGFAQDTERTLSGTWTTPLNLGPRRAARECGRASGILPRSYQRFEGKWEQGNIGDILIRTAQQLELLTDDLYTACRKGDRYRELPEDSFNRLCGEVYAELMQRQLDLVQPDRPGGLSGEQSEPRGMIGALSRVLPFRRRRLSGLPTDEFHDLLIGVCSVVGRRRTREALRRIMARR